MPWPPRFLFLSGRLAIDFAQTGGEGWRARWERWGSPSDLADWFRASELDLDLPVSPTDLRRARRLREAVWGGAQDLLAGRPVAPASVAELERAAARPDLVPVLAEGRRAWAPSSTATQALSSVARDAIELFGGELAGRLRECANPRCPLLFVDGSRPGRRTWCAMRRCGNLRKTTRYRRKKAARRAGGPEETP